MKSSCKPYAAGIDGVALFTRAWIEMSIAEYNAAVQLVALFTRAWIEIKILSHEVFKTCGRPLYEGVD